MPSWHAIAWCLDPYGALSQNWISDVNHDEHAQLRLCDCRWRFGWMCVGGKTHGGAQRERSAPRGGGCRQNPRDQHPHCLAWIGQNEVRLGFCERTRTDAQWTAHLYRPGKNTRWKLRRQCHDLYAW